MISRSDLYLVAVLLVVLSVVLSVGTTLLILRSAVNSVEVTPGTVSVPSPLPVPTYEPAPLPT